MLQISRRPLAEKMFPDPTLEEERYGDTSEWKTQATEKGAFHIRRMVGISL